jgi:hypothetical protein
VRWFAAFAIIGYAASPAGAQQANPPATGKTPTPQVGFQQQMNGNCGESQLSVMAANVAGVEAQRAAVAKRLARARAQRDVVKTLFLNEKLNQIDVNVRAIRERQRAHASAVQRCDLQLASHELTVATMVREQVDHIGSEANQAVGDSDIGGIDSAGGTATAQTVTSVDPGLPGGDQTAFAPFAATTPPPPTTTLPPGNVVSPSH